MDKEIIVIDSTLILPILFMGCGVYLIYHGWRLFIKGKSSYRDTDTFGRHVQKIHVEADRNMKSFWDSKYISLGNIKGLQHVKVLVNPILSRVIGLLGILVGIGIIAYQLLKL
jgi:threonine/homoserine/homoserine lactone efflux protein